MNMATSACSAQQCTRAMRSEGVVKCSACEQVMYLSTILTLCDAASLSALLANANMALLKCWLMHRMRTRKYILERRDVPDDAAFAASAGMVQPTVRFPTHLLHAGANWGRFHCGDVCSFCGSSALLTFLQTCRDTGSVPVHRRRLAKLSSGLQDPPPPPPPPGGGGAPPPGGRQGGRSGWW